MEFIDLKAQYVALKGEIDRRIAAVLDHGQYILGPEVQELEALLANFAGVEHAIGVGNGTDALQLALMALEIGPGDAVFTSAFSFVASAEVISLVGATPVFVDIDASSYNISPEALADSITAVLSAGRLKPKAVIGVDMFGLPADYPALTAVSEGYGIAVIEDGAQSFGASIDGRRSGSFGVLAATSFFPAKPLGCYGDGGAVFTNDDRLADVVKSLRVHGKGRDKYDNVRIGMNSRLDTIQAAILLAKMQVFDQELDRRREIAKIYGESLREKYVVPESAAGYVSAWAQYTVRPRYENRDRVISNLRDRGVPTAIYYGKPLHLQTAFAKLMPKSDGCPVAEKISTEVLSLPMHPYMSEEDLEEIIAALI